MQPPDPFPADSRPDWLLNPAVAFLNHGSFGSVPRPVLEEQERWRRRLEADPIELIARQRDALLNGVKSRLGRFLHADPADIGLVTNATEGINAILRSIGFESGDELLTTDHVYHAVRQTMKYVAGRTGASYREVPIPLPIGSPEEIVEQVTRGLGPKTRLLLVDHVASPTALVFPIARLIEVCRDRGIDVLVDGAHAPGMLDLDLNALGAAYYAGNLHKWCCAPKGSAFVHVRKDRQSPVHPNVISHDCGKGMIEFNWQGTRDLSAWLTIPTALEYMAKLGWDKVRGHNHALAAWAQEMICRKWQLAPLYGQDSLIGSMATLCTPPGFEKHPFDPLQQRLYSEFQVEAPVVDWNQKRYVRVSAQVYNTPSDYARLAEVVLKLSRSA